MLPVFAYSTPTWRSPVSGQVRGLVAAYPNIAGDLVMMRLLVRGSSG